MTVETKSFRRDRLDLRVALFDKSVLVLAGLAIVSGVACWWIAGAQAVTDSLYNDVFMFLELAPKMAIAFFVAALVTALVPRAFIAKWLGEKAGFKGVALATGVGAVTPGGPMISFPLVSSLSKAGAARSTVIAYLTSWETLGFQRIMIWEIPLLGVEYTLMRFIASIPLPFVAALVADYLPRNEEEKRLAALAEAKDEASVKEDPQAKS
jgi:uncharacterized membrane protein YraQ (UPF0718 family)